MKRWNGWGDDTVTYPVPENAAAFLETRVGAGTSPRDVTLAEVVAQVPESRLPDPAGDVARLITTDMAERARHARGQSFPDLVALHSGRMGTFPDGVAYPTTDEDARALIRYGLAAGVRLIPYGGGTSVVGHINPLPGDAPVLTVDMGRLMSLRDLDETCLLASFGAGVAGPDLEAQLRARGYTLGHFPQSFELSTLGGWVVTRSSGQQSLGFGRIEDLFAGGRLETPAGEMELPPYPASAAGPDLRQLVLGSEGRLGILTEATVRVTPRPEREEFHAVFFPDFERGRTAVRAIVQAGLPLSMMRLSTAVETETTLALAGHEWMIGGLERYLSLRGAKAEKSLLLVGFTGRRSAVKMGRHEALGLAADHDGVHVGQILGKQWEKSRFRAPYLRNTLWEQGYGVDTLETATEWCNVPTLLDAIEAALRGAMAEHGERVHVFTHLSHVYPWGSSIYTTFLFRLAADPDEMLRRWQGMKAAASEAIVAGGGTISHQHGVGLDHRPYLAAEKGPLGMETLRAMAHVFDPQEIMNPGKLFLTNSKQ